LHGAGLAGHGVRIIARLRSDGFDLTQPRAAARNLIEIKAPTFARFILSAHPMRWTMSIGEIIVVSGIIGTFSIFLIGLAWADYTTRRA
jgi:hypothetical protein